MLEYSKKIYSVHRSQKKDILRDVLLLLDMRDLLDADCPMLGK